MSEKRRIIDETNYRQNMPTQQGPSAIGKGGDPLFMNIRATKAQLEDLLEETTTIQDWIQRETCNNVALSCLDNENLKDIYQEIKNGFGEFGPLILMGYKTPQGVEIPRMKVLSKEGEVIKVLTGPMVYEELNKRAIAYKNIQQNYEVLDLPIEQNEGVIADYTEPIKDYK